MLAAQPKGVCFFDLGNDLIGLVASKLRVSVYKLGDYQQAQALSALYSTSHSVREVSSAHSLFDEMRWWRVIHTYSSVNFFEHIVRQFATAQFRNNKPILNSTQWANIHGATYTYINHRLNKYCSSNHHLYNKLQPEVTLLRNDLEFFLELLLPISVKYGFLFDECVARCCPKIESNLAQDGMGLVGRMACKRQREWETLH